MRTAFSLAVSLALAGCGSDAAGAPAAVQPAEAGGIRVVDTDGLMAEIAAHKGHPLLVNFWAMWCDPCVAELPDLQGAAVALRREGGDVLAVAMDLTAPGQKRDGVLAKLPVFLKARELDFPVVLFGSHDAIPLLQRLDLPGGIPVTLAIDRDGKVVGKHANRASALEFQDLVDLACGK